MEENNNQSTNENLTNNVEESAKIASSNLNQNNTKSVNDYSNPNHFEDNMDNSNANHFEDNMDNSNPNHFGDNEDSNDQKKFEDNVNINGMGNLSSAKATENLISGWLLYGIFLSILYGMILAPITARLGSVFLRAVVVIVLQGISGYILWKLSVSSTFKKATIQRSDVSKVMKNLVIFVILLCFVLGSYNFSKLDETIDSEIESSADIKILESKVQYIYDNESKQEYNDRIEEIKKEAKSKCYIYMFFTEVGIACVQLAVIPLAKKEILKHVNE